MKFKYIKGAEKDFEGAPEWVTHKISGGYSDFYGLVGKHLFYAKYHSFLKGKSGHSDIESVLESGNYSIIAQREPIIESQSWYEKGELPPVGEEVIWIDESGTKSPGDVSCPGIGDKVKIITHSKTYDGRHPVAVFKWMHKDGETQLYAASGHYLDFKPLKTKEQKEKEEMRDDLSSLKLTDFDVHVGILSSKLYDMGWRKVEGEKK